MVLEDVVAHLQNQHKYPLNVMRSKRSNIILPPLVDGNLSTGVYTYQNNNFLFEVEMKKQLLYINMFAMQPKDVPPTYTIHISTTHPSINYQYNNIVPSIQHRHESIENYALIIPLFQFKKLRESNNGVKLNIMFERINEV
jgi:hypothetical protein